MSSNVSPIFLHAWRSILGSLSNGGGNENGKKAIDLDWQNDNFDRASRFFVHFFAVNTRLRRHFHVLLRTWTQHNDFIFIFVNLETVVQNSTHEKSSPLEKLKELK